ncbi:MAG: hypothetical protein JW727_03645 [Candidatus Aenigmarchaeota archaeon]|nr:hypothetical protein [Candidatus Aenigmarchaeota archaeon]
MITANPKENRASDWKDHLCVEDEQKLNELLEAARRHRCAYHSSDNVQVAQVWCALIEMMKMVNKLEARVSYIERVLNHLFEGHQGEKEKLLSGLLKF